MKKVIAITIVMLFIGSSMPIISIAKDTNYIVSQSQPDIKLNIETSISSIIDNIDNNNKSIKKYQNEKNDVDYQNPILSEILVISNSYYKQVINHPQNKPIIFIIQYDPDGTNLYVSHDSGNTWNYKTHMTYLVFDENNPNIAYGFYQKCIYMSNDGGETFNLMNQIPHYIGSILIDRFNPNKIYISGRPSISSDDWGIYISDDSGQTIEFKSFRDSIDVPIEYMDATIGRIIWDMDQDPQNPDILYFTGEDSDHSVYPSWGGDPELWPDPYFVIRTLDGCTTFENVSSGLPWHSITAKSYIDSLGMTQWIMGSEGYGMYKLDLSQDIWIEYQIGIEGEEYGIIWDYLIDSNNQNIHYFSKGKKMFISTNNGFSWQLFFSYQSNFRIFRIIDISIDSEGTVYFINNPKSLCDDPLDNGGLYRIKFLATTNGPYYQSVDEIVQFSGSVICGGFEPYNWIWDFGDGETSTDQNPEHRYENIGDYTITLHVTDSTGQIDVKTSLTHIIEFQHQYLEIDIGGPYGSLIGDEIQFTGSATGGVSPYSWNWNFGDCITSNEQNPLHTYTYSVCRIYPVELTVIDSDGLESSDNTFAYTFFIDAGGPYQGFTDDEIHFIGSSSCAPVPCSWNWDFGDGSSGTEKELNHTYSEQGEYVITLFVTDAWGSNGIVETVAIISDYTTPIANAGDDCYGIVNELVQFTGSATGGVEPYTFEWDFDGDNIIDAEGSVVEHTFTTANTYDVKLIVTDDNGNIDVDIKTIIVVDITLNVMYVDDDYYEGGYNDGHFWNLNAFDNIQDGIDSVENNGRVYVNSGIYNHVEIVYKNVFLIGENKATTIIEGDENTDAITLYSSHSCGVTGFTVRNSNHGIYLIMANRNTIYNNIITGNNCGIKTMLSNNILYNNYFTNNDENSYDNYQSNEWYNQTLKIGNYWDDFESNPGFPDVYQIPGGNNVDIYPNRGDLDHDCDVDGDDLDMIIELQGATSDDPESGYNPEADMDDNGIINSFDRLLLLQLLNQ